MRYSCKAVVGHGQICEPNYQCDACAAKQKYISRIETLENALKEILSLGSWGANDLARTVAREALEATSDPLDEEKKR
jgi:hypothetical protein